MMLCMRFLAQVRQPKRAAKYANWHTNQSGYSKRIWRGFELEINFSNYNKLILVQLFWTKIKGLYKSQLNQSSSFVGWPFLWTHVSCKPLFGLI